ncbi:MAG: hypothetical protein ACRDRT_17000, partial [Pseudonocardiaceae bacterium]
ALLDRAQADATVGCVGPRTLDDDGAEYPSRRSFPTMMTAAVHRLLGSVRPANPATRRYHAADHSSRPVFRSGLGVGVLHVAAAAGLGKRGWVR